MPILVKGDEMRTGKKANACYRGRGQHGSQWVKACVSRNAGSLTLIKRLTQASQCAINIRVLTT